MTLEWGKFHALSGAQDKNFELLCRGIIRHTFGQYGKFVSHANMAGVEFYLELDSDCSLGKKNRVFGWQCKWFEIEAGKPLGKNRRDIIEDGIKKTKKYHPNVTDWILWTKNTLTKSDQRWFNAIKTDLKLQLYDSNDIEKNKVGLAEVFIKSYFGELAISDHQMSELTNISISPIKQRWTPELHQETGLDRQVKKILGCRVSWNILEQTSNELEKVSNVLLEKLIKYPESADYLDDATALIFKSISFYEHLRECKKSLEEGATDWADLIDDANDLTVNERSVPRKFRQKNDFNGLLFTNLLASYFEGKESLTKLKKSLKQSSLVISSDAGNGKTEFCAQLCSGLVDGIQGLIIHGKNLASSTQYNELVKPFTINGKTFESLESLICSLNSYGERSKKRILIAFDGLNESEDSRRWKDIIPQIQTIAQKYQRVFCLFTIRPDYLQDSIPNGDVIEVIKGKGFDDNKDANEAIKKYFTYYKINSVGGALPREMLRHPLSLKLFCEVTNSKRDFVVNINSGPQSLYALFEMFTKTSSERIADLSNNNHRIFGGDVQKALSAMGEQLWTSKARGIKQDEFRALANDSARPWNFSLLNALESEGVLIRNRHDSNEIVMPVYDRLAGYLIAEAILEKCSSDNFKDWIADQNNFRKLFGSYTEQHPYCEDIISAMVALLPKRFYGVNLWTFLTGLEKDKALIKCSELEKANLDQNTISELENLIFSGKATESLWIRLYFLHNIDNHPLNIEFTEHVLTKMDITIRDRTWSEWVRSQKEGFISVLKHFASELSGTTQDSRSASYFKWCLTLSDREIRDVASKSIFLFGLKKPEIVFSEAIKSLSLNDDYIPMRLVPICFGIITNLNIDDEIKNNILNFYSGLSSSLLIPNASNPTNNIVIRQYFLKITEYLLHKKIIQKSNASVDFAIKVEPLSIQKSDPSAQNLSRVLGMDFENYTLGTLFRDRRNYDNNHTGHQDCVSYIRGLLASFGWNTKEMMELDQRLNSYRDRGNRNPVERYGKKYSWIGYYRYAGILEQAGKLNVHYDDFRNGDIDPSFIRPPIADSLSFSTVDFKSHSDDKDWFTKSKVTFPKDVYKRKEVVRVKAPWVLVHGYFSEKDEITNRKVYGFIQSVLVKKSDVKKIVKAFNKKDPYELLRHEAPSTHETLANEIPWSKAALQAFEEYENYESKEIEGASVEYLVYEYKHEKNEKWLNSASSYCFPTYRFINKQDLIRVPKTLAFCSQNKKLASINLKQSSDEENCNLFYMNLDELKKYAKGKALLTFCWGEKELGMSYYERESWLTELLQSGRNFWKNVFIQNL